MFEVEVVEVHTTIIHQDWYSEEDEMVHIIFQMQLLKMFDGLFQMF